VSSLLFGLLSALFSSGTTAAAFVLNDVYASLHTPIATIAPRLTHGIEGSPSENPLRQLVTDVNDNMADVSNLALPRLSWQCISLSSCGAATGQSIWVRHQLWGHAEHERASAALLC
jgi:hypothetical protein